MTAAFKAFRETALPAQLQPAAIYMIAPPERADYVEMYVTDRNGRARRIINTADVEALIHAAISASGALTVVENIAARNAISQPRGEVYVLDAGADPTVSSGGARYLYHNGKWIKTAETEAMDTRLTWDLLIDKPSATAAQIDAAVNHSHTHDNQTQLNKIGENSEGQLTYGGEVVTAQWRSTGW